MLQSELIGFLAERLEDFHQLARDDFVAAHDIAGLKRGVAALNAANGAAGLAHHEDAGCEIPRLEVALPIAIEAARGDECHIERRRAEAAQARAAWLQICPLAARQIMVAASDMRTAAGTHAVLVLLL